MSFLEEHYKVLDASPSASIEEIRVLYRDLAQVWHPDRFQENARLREKAEAKLKAINHAYEAIREGHRSGIPPRSAHTHSEKPSTPPPGRPAGNHSVPEAEADALGWYAKAASEGHADAQCIIATMYAEGRRVPRDEGKAIEWFKRSAAQGHAAAEFQMGLRYYSGGGVEKDPRQALNHYRRAALQGHAKAQFNLGLMLTNGAQIKQDNPAAFAWFTIASENGHAEAEPLRQSVAGTLTPDQRSESKKIAADLRARIRQVI
ncbi:MAG: J domain-containing protein [Verrucomicrobiales bacterium]